MENLLNEYMTRRLRSDYEYHEINTGKGPVITISRQAGCGASKLAHDLCQHFNASGKSEHHPAWHFINHEILERSAEKLELDPKKLDRVITDKERGIMDQIVEALSGHSHKSDQKIMKTVQDVVRQYAEHGNVVIVGRGGAVVSRHLKRSLHVRLEAPQEWRVEQVMKKLEFSRDYAHEYVRKIDEQREMYVHRMLPSGRTSDLYDVILNPSHFSNHEMVEIVLFLAGMKGIV